MNLILVGPYPPSYFGQSLAFKYAHDFLTDHFNVKLFSFNYRQSGESILRYLVNSLLRFSKLLFLLLITKKTTVYISATRGKVSIYRDLIACALCILRSHPYVLHMHGNDLFLYHTKSWIRWPMVKYVYHRASEVVVLNKFMQMEFEKELQRPTRIIANGIENVQKPNDRNGGLNKRPYTFIYLSNLHYSKGIIHLIEAFKKINNKEHSLIIAGAPMDDSYYSANKIEEIFLDKIGSDARIEFLGRITSDEVKFQYLEQSSFFVLPTFYEAEAFPLSIIEAMSAGCAIISTNHNGIDQYKNASKNFIIDVDDLKDEETLKTQLERCAKLDLSSLSKISISNIETAKKHYTLKKYQNEILATLKTIA